MQAVDISSPDLSDILSLDGDTQLPPLGDSRRDSRRRQATTEVSLLSPMVAMVKPKTDCCNHALRKTCRVALHAICTEWRLQRILPSGILDEFRTHNRNVDEQTPKTGTTYAKVPSQGCP